MSSLRVGMPGAGCQVGVARISGQTASPVTDSLYLSAMLPSDFSIVFQPPNGGRPAAQGHLALAHARVQREGRCADAQESAWASDSPVL